MREASGGITAEQLHAVKYWSCDIGGETPTGRWQILIEHEMTREGHSVEDVLIALTIAAAAMFNSGIGCWVVKFEYCRPLARESVGVRL